MMECDTFSVFTDLSDLVLYSPSNHPGFEQKYIFTMFLNNSLLPYL